MSWLMVPSPPEILSFYTDGNVNNKIWPYFTQETGHGRTTSVTINNSQKTLQCGYIFIQKINSKCWKSLALCNSTWHCRVPQWLKITGLQMAHGTSSVAHHMQDAWIDLKFWSQSFLQLRIYTHDVTYLSCCLTSLAAERSFVTSQARTAQLETTAW